MSDIDDGVSERLHRIEQALKTERTRRSRVDERIQVLLSLRAKLTTGVGADD